MCNPIEKLKIMNNKELLGQSDLMQLLNVGQPKAKEFIEMIQNEVIEEGKRNLPGNKITKKRYLRKVSKTMKDYEDEARRYQELNLSK